MKIEDIRVKQIRSISHSRLSPRLVEDKNILLRHAMRRTRSILVFASTLISSSFVYMNLSNPNIQRNIIWLTVVIVSLLSITGIRMINMCIRVTREEKRFIKNLKRYIRTSDTWFR